MEQLERRELLAGDFSIFMAGAGQEPDRPTSPAYADFMVSLTSADPSPGSVHWAAFSGAGDTATPGIDFDPHDGRHFLRFCYAGSAADMREAVERIGGWLKRG